MKKDKLLCCDWGTSNFRLYLLDIPTNKVIRIVKADQGIAATFDAWQNNTSKNRVYFFRNFLQLQVQRLAVEINKNLDKIPIILSGMASSSIGMQEVPYASIPFSIHQPTLSVKHYPSDAILPNDLLLYGGLRTAQDVMRGEEVQLLGLSHLINAPTCVCLLPGTHSKHIWIKNKTVVDFQTFMTGECFQLISSQSILKNSVQFNIVFGKSQQEIFKKGVLEAQSGNLLNNLFKIRTNTLLSDISQELLALQNFQGQLLLSCEKYLATLYQLALSTLQLDQNLTTASVSDMERCIPNAHFKLFQHR